VGNVVRPRPIVHVLGMDALRYYLLRETVFGQDGNFSYDAIVQRYNSDLANGLGNLASRTLTMIRQYCDGRAPGLHAPANQRDKQVVDLTKNVTVGVFQHYDRLEFSRALEAIWGLIAEVDKYLVETAPWTIAKDWENKAVVARILYFAYDALRTVTVLAHPIIPKATQEVWRQMGQPGVLGDQNIDALTEMEGPISPTVATLTAVFPRIEKAEAVERMEAMENEPQKPPAALAAAPAPSSAAAAPQAAPDKIGIEDFTKVEMRVGQIKTAERIVGADKLLKLTVDIGTEIRQICAGIAQYYEPEKLIGRKVAVVVNLAPRKLRGVESNGMIIAASVGPEGRPVLAGFPDEDVEIGARLK
jgi:methionyl-tRNA synthetase